LLNDNLGLIIVLLLVLSKALLAATGLFLVGDRLVFFVLIFGSNRGVFFLDLVSDRLNVDW